MHEESVVDTIIVTSRERVGVLYLAEVCIDRISDNHFSIQPDEPQPRRLFTGSGANASQLQNAQHAACSNQQLAESSEHREMMCPRAHKSKSLITAVYFSCGHKVKRFGRGAILHVGARWYSA